ncbi:hypothetical protein ECDEC2B_4929 [Escherichia coli DEC2B]|nr:conserved hypothetical protein [Escherichia coli 2362-75]EHU03428.1 hypothetical protein ECDEC1A_4674 [Escherichia coli DEC1A]EHU06892.1 hypothetical protein ECDEC1C_3571 [Escherichia coli DEC1C]EHU21806.1 hypothetical protein ECDEC2A_4875 [Escherichia coli DEC2A]EHU34552.1 hypothetical protein ECDEC2B_4929 [Escherichia coli DEC2B]
MRALLTPEIAPRMGIVLFRPGSELMPLFMPVSYTQIPTRGFVMSVSLL